MFKRADTAGAALQIDLSEHNCEQVKKYPFSCRNAMSQDMDAVPAPGPKPPTPKKERYLPSFSRSPLRPRQPSPAPIPEPARPPPRDPSPDSWQVCCQYACVLSSRFDVIRFGQRVQGDSVRSLMLFVCAAACSNAQGSGCCACVLGP